MIVPITSSSTLASGCSSSAAEVELELLIREARRRQRRRRFVVLGAVLATAGGYLAIRSVVSPPVRAVPLLSRPLHFPPLRLGGRCPVTSGYAVHNRYFVGGALGMGPVRVLVGQSGDVLHGRPMLGSAASGPWHALQTLWFAMPGYDGPFVVRAARLGKPGAIEVQPGETGLVPGSGPLIVPAGPTLNSFPTPTGSRSWAGYRTVPGSTWVTSPGCYAWQVDGRGFSEVIVFDAQSPSG